MSLFSLLKERQKRNKLILVLLTLVFLITLYFNFFKKDPYLPGAERAVFCTSCKAIGAKIIVDIDDDKDLRNYCKICNGRLRYAVKCLKCQYEFPLSPIDTPPPSEKTHTMDKFRYLRDKELCPNCKFDPPDTVFISSDQIQKKSEL